MRRQACGLCRVAGHNRRTCTAPDVAAVRDDAEVPLTAVELEHLGRISRRAA